MITSVPEFTNTTERMLDTMMSCIEWYYYKQNINEATITFIFNRVYIPSETEMMAFYLMVLHILEQNQRRPWVLES